jgi:hypothetical protein
MALIVADIYTTSNVRARDIAALRQRVHAKKGVAAEAANDNQQRLALNSNRHFPLNKARG